MTSLFVDRRGVELKLDGEALVFAENGERVGTVPLMPLSRVYLRGDVKLSASLLGKLGEHGIGVVVLSGRLGRDINPTIYSRADLRKKTAAGNSFVTRVLAQPRLWVIGGEHDFGA